MDVSNDWIKQRDSDFLLVLRALSIFIIVAGHLGAFWIWRPWSEFLHVFVPIFFFISGAVSYNAYLKSNSVVFYLKKRIIGILIPYYCICILALIVFVLIHGKLPSFSLDNLLRWLTITPSNALMPFPLGQVWFLHTLSIIIFASPGIFWLYRRSFLFPVLLFCPIALSLLQHKFNIGPCLIISGHNLYTPLVHSLFFCLGFLVFNISKLRSRYFLISAIVASALLSIIFVKGLRLNPDYAFHIYYPDFYYVAGSLCSIWIFILLQSQIVHIYAKFTFVQITIRFFFKYTFAIYLLHSFAIFFVEEVFGLVHPQQVTVTYAITKFSFVFAITLVLSPMFSKISSSLIKVIVTIIDCLIDKFRLIGFCP